MHLITMSWNRSVPTHFSVIGRLKYTGILFIFFCNTRLKRGTVIKRILLYRKKRVFIWKKLASPQDNPKIIQNNQNILKYGFY